MEQASRVLAGLDALRQSCEPGDIVCAAWKRAVGKRIAAHARASKLVRTKLVIEVEDWLWQRNLMGMSEQILRRLELGVGPGLVTELEFRAIPARLGPKVAESSMRATEPGDEADGINDPGLRRIYRSQREKEMA